MIDDEQIETPEVEPEGEAPEPVEPEPQPAPEPEVYTREQLAELLGPRFERFAMHEGDEAFRQFGSAYTTAANGYLQGAHLAPQDAAFYQQAGIDENEIPQPEPEPGPSIYGAPWETPTTWDEYVAYAQSDSPEQRRLAAYGVLQSEQADQATKQWFYNQWAAADPHGAAAYVQQTTLSAAEQRLADLEVRLEAKYSASSADLVERNVSSLMEVAKSQIPGFEQHAATIDAIWRERTSREPAFTEWFFTQATTAEQLKELRRITLVAAAEDAPARDAANAAASADTNAAKLRARTETSRTSGSPESSVDESTRQRREAMRRVGARIT